MCLLLFLLILCVSILRSHSLMQPPSRLNLFLKKQYINCVYHPRAAHSFSKNFRFNRQERYDTQRGNSSYFAPPLRPFAFSSRTLRLNPNLNPKKKNYQLCFPSASSAQRTAHSFSKKTASHCVYTLACRLQHAAFPLPHSTGWSTHNIPASWIY